MGHFGFEPYLGVAAPGRFTEHAVDGDTVAHWTFDRDDTDQVGVLDQDGAAGLCYAPIFGEPSGDYRNALCSQQSTGYQVNNATSLKISELTVACWICMTDEPAQTISVVGFRLPGTSGTDPNLFNFAWELSYTNLGVIRFNWQSGNKVDHLAIGPTLALNRWHHIIGTRNAAQTTGRIYVNGTKQGEVTGASPHNGGTSVPNLDFLNNGSSVGAIGALATAIVKDVEVNDAQAAALYRSTLIG